MLLQKNVVKLYIDAIEIASEAIFRPQVCNSYGKHNFYSYYTYSL